MTATNPPSARAPRFKRLDLFTRTVVAVLWLAAAILKIADPAAFARDIENYQLVPSLAAAVGAVYLPWFEVALGVGLWVPGFRDTARALSIVLLAGFCVVLTAALARGLDIDCGCFGSGGPDASAAWALARNLALIALLAATCVKAKSPDAAS